MISKLPKEHPLHDRHYTIVTGQMMEFHQKVQYILEQNLPGMIAYGVARIGKTTCINAVIKILREDFGDEVAIEKTIVETHNKSQQKSFYREMCDNLGIDIPSKSTTGSQLRSLIIEHLILAGRSHANRVLLIVDEASLMLDDDYHYLMDIYNRLESFGIRLICVLVGTEIMAGKKKHLISIGETQVIGRFMVNEFVFRPVTGTGEIKEVLKGFDRDIMYNGAPLTKDMFPANYEDGKRLALEADNIACAVREIVSDTQSKKSKNKTEVSIQMQYLIMAIELVMKENGKYDGTEVWPCKKDWADALYKVGFREALLCA